MCRTKETQYIVVFFAIMFLTTSQAQDVVSRQESDKYQLTSFANVGISINNSIGIGTFVSGFARVPQWVTSFALDPELPIPLFENGPKVYAFGSLSADVWWLSSNQTSSYDLNNRIQFSDLRLGISVPKAIEFSEIGISLSGNLPISIAISAPSRALNRILAFGLIAGLKWNKGEFSVGYFPSTTVWIHSDESKTIPCFDSADFDLSAWPANPGRPDAAIDRYLVSIASFRDEEKDEDGNCRISGRQSVWGIKNAVTAAWSSGSHRVSAGLSYYWNFLRPLLDRPELSGIHSNSSGMTQAVLGRMAYSYSLPSYIDTTVTAGITSYQGIFSKSGALLFPFFDFATPNKNQTQVFVEVATNI